MIGNHPFARSDGGPLLLMPHGALSSWEGTRHPSGGRVIEVAWQFDPTGPATDYDRACNAPNLVSTIVSGAHEALVLGSFTDNATWMPFAGGIPGGIIVRVVSIDDDVRLEHFIRSLTAAAFPAAAISWHVSERSVRLFDSASSKAARLNSDDYVDVTLEPGQYEVRTLEWHDPEVAEVVLHHAARVSD